MNELELDNRLRSLTERTAALSPPPEALARLHLEVDAEAAVHRVSPALPGGMPVPAWVWLVGVLLVGLVVAGVAWARPAAPRRQGCECRLPAPGWPGSWAISPGQEPPLEEPYPAKLAGLFTPWRAHIAAELSGCDSASNRPRLEQLAAEVCREAQMNHTFAQRLRERDLAVAEEARRLGIPEAARRIGPPPGEPTEAELYLSGFRPVLAALAGEAGVSVPMQCDPAAAPGPEIDALPRCQPGSRLRGSAGFVGGPNPKITATPSDPPQKQLDAFIWQLDWRRLKVLYAEQERRETFETIPPDPKTAAAVARQKIGHLCEMYQLERRWETDDHEVSDAFLEQARHFAGVLKRLDPSETGAAPCAERDGG